MAAGRSRASWPSCRGIARGAHPRWLPARLPAGCDSRSAGMLLRLMRRPATIHDGIFSCEACPHFAGACEGAEDGARKPPAGSMAHARKLRPSSTRSGVMGNSVVAMSFGRGWNRPRASLRRSASSSRPLATAKLAARAVTAAITTETRQTIGSRVVLRVFISVPFIPWQPRRKIEPAPPSASNFVCWPSYCKLIPRTNANEKANVRHECYYYQSFRLARSQIR